MDTSNSNNTSNGQAINSSVVVQTVEEDLGKKTEKSGTLKVGTGTGPLQNASTKGTNVGLKRKAETSTEKSGNTPIEIARNSGLYRKEELNPAQNKEFLRIIGEKNFDKVVAMNLGEIERIFNNLQLSEEKQVDILVRTQELFNAYVFEYIRGDKKLQKPSEIFCKLIYF